MTKRSIFLATGIALMILFGVGMVYEWFVLDEFDVRGFIVTSAMTIMLVVYLNEKKGEVAGEKRLTFAKVQEKVEERFDPLVAKEVIAILEERRIVLEDKGFREWLRDLNFDVPGELSEKGAAITLYDKNPGWFEREVKRLEDESERSWRVQTEELEQLDERARKAQLVVRERLTEIVWEIKDGSEA
ncbi:hypothetical protein [Alteribacter aurantiacus]|uniref:hypothetical protein n=1 Tax=Alteribacter aurantiacus TaxID=254410 RepID=UPI0003F7C5FA|nr:hypothetical protein [Alteribacter aurantiacus]